MCTPPAWERGRWRPEREEAALVGTLSQVSLRVAAVSLVGSSSNRLAGRSPSGSVARSDGVWKGRDTTRLLRERPGRLCCGNGASSLVQGSCSRLEGGQGCSSVSIPPKTSSVPFQNPFKAKYANCQVNAFY